MDKLINKMRADFALVSEARIASGDWTDELVVDIREAIKAAIDEKNASMIAHWARWLADLSCFETSWALVVRATEDRMREAARQHRSQGERKAA